VFDSEVRIAFCFSILFWPRFAGRRALGCNFGFFWGSALPDCIHTSRLPNCDRDPRFWKSWKSTTLRVSVHEALCRCPRSSLLTEVLSPVWSLYIAMSRPLVDASRVYVRENFICASWVHFCLGSCFSFLPRQQAFPPSVRIGEERSLRTFKIVFTSYGLAILSYLDLDGISKYLSLTIER